MLRNIFGRAEEWSCEYTHGTKKTTSFYSTFVKPFHNEASTVLTSSIYQQASEAPWSGYRELDRGVLLTLAFNSAPNVQQKLILDGVWRHITTLSRTTAFAVREQAGHSLKSALRHELHVDKRDDQVFPTDGVSFTLKNELAGLGGDIGFLKNELDMQVNVPLPRDIVLQGALLAGHLLPLRNNKTYIIADRFMLGGPMNIRGFEMAGIGPHSDGCSLGAEMFWAAAIHVYAPLPLLARGGSISEKFRLHGFVNTGNIGDFVLSEYDEPFIIKDKFVKENQKYIFLYRLFNRLLLLNHDFCHCCLIVHCILGYHSGPIEISFSGSLFVYLIILGINSC
ncbi:sorting and assembly machinery component 50 homolog [Macrobrachium nipponense]|uniref:sorting and assembly machinery component 50 homolog n=1 Tax=Macrobrachium nipponense TaxID=159736 RepID=UPI0030C8B900